MLDLRNKPNHLLYGDFTVTITESFSPGLDDVIHPVAIAVNKIVAEVLHWYLSKKNTWDDMTQTGSYCWVISRKLCTNHEDFEEEYNPLDDIYDDDELSFA